MQLHWVFPSLSSGGVTEAFGLLGPFPLGTVVRRLTAYWAEDGGMGAVFGVFLEARVGLGMPASAAEFATFDPLIKGASNMNLCIPRQFAVELDVELSAGRYIALRATPDASTNPASLTVSAVVELPSLEEAVASAVPGSFKLPTSAGKTAKAPHVLNRSAVPLPIQSKTQPTIQPVPSYGRK